LTYSEAFGIIHYDTAEKKEGSVEQLGAVIKRVRHERRWSQKELAERLGLARPTITNWELGNHQPRRICLRALEQVLEMNLMDNSGNATGEK
jgi:ribosome-binding protein aMBF1 (putative translation factor)